MKKQLASAVLAILAVSAAPSAWAAKNLPEEKPVAEKGPEGRSRMGVLACEVEGGIGLVIGSSRAVNCTFKNRETGNTDTYEGNITKIGLDIGVTGKQYLRWAVFAPDAVTLEDGFSGRYSGLSGSGALVVSFGANALIGGSEKQIVLQPFSLQTGTGFNVALGVSSMKLTRAQ